MRRLAVILTFLLMAGCGQKAEQAPPKLEVVAPKSFDPATAATIKGRIVYEGAIPAPRELSIKGNPECAVFHPGGKMLSEELVGTGGGLQNVFVYVKEGLEGTHFDPPTEPVVIENKNCVYVPHVAGVQAGQPVVFLNNDPTLHNIHSYPKNSKAFNLGLPFQGIKQTRKFESPEVMVQMKCDVHPWMVGYIGVLAHPFFGVSGADGSFELKGLPPGEYLIEAWHEKLGAQSQKVTIGPQETKEIEFRFSAA